MSIELRCGHCGDSFRVAEGLRGQAIRCIKCRSQLLVPTSANSAPGSKVEDDIVAKPGNSSDSQTVSLVCFGCTARLSAPSTMIGSTSKCPRCGAAVIVFPPLPKGWANLHSEAVAGDRTLNKPRDLPPHQVRTGLLEPRLPLSDVFGFARTGRSRDFAFPISFCEARDAISRKSDLIYWTLFVLRIVPIWMSA